MKLVVENVAYKLGPKEFRAIAHIFSRRGDWVSTEELSRVMGISVASVRHCIFRARVKLGRECIKSRRNKGYRWNS